MLAQAVENVKAPRGKLPWRVLPGGRARERRAKPEVLREGAARFTAEFTRSRRDILKIQRMRYRIFSREYGASISTPFGLDRDRFDRHCLHLVVRDNRTGELAGYTRVLPGERAGRTGGFYSAGEFDMPMVARLDGAVAEIGRTCIDPRYRGGAVIAVLWARLARYMLENDVRYLLGCASVALGEGHDLVALDQRLRERHWASPRWRVHSRHRLRPLPGGATGGRVTMPPLLKAYLRMGARVCGEPYWDEAFNCLDYFILMSVDQLPERYVQHFLQPARAL